MKTRFWRGESAVVSLRHVRTCRAPPHARARAAFSHGTAMGAASSAFSASLPVPTLWAVGLDRTSEALGSGLALRTARVPTAGLRLDFFPIHPTIALQVPRARPFEAIMDHHHAYFMFRNATPEIQSTSPGSAPYSLRAFHL